MPPQKSELHITAPWYLPAMIGGGIALAALIGSSAFYSARALDNVLSVTGSAKTSVTADSVKWTITISRKVSEFNLPSSYALIAADLAQTRTFLTGKGIAADAITTSPVSTSEIYNYNGTGGPREFNVEQRVVIQSKDVTGVDAIAKSIGDLAAKGVFISSNYLEFFVSSLPELRVSLLGAALKDAKARATEIAKAGDQSVGRLKAASSGVVQVLAPNSIDVADYGSYDTSTIEKDVSVTVRATFLVR